MSTRIGSISGVGGPFIGGCVGVSVVIGVNTAQGEIMIKDLSLI